MKLWCAMLWLLLAGAQPGREAEEFRLYKLQQPVGVERTVRVHHADGTTEIRTNFSFTDRGRTVPLAATLVLAGDGSVLRYEEWGSTSRITQVDDRVSVERGAITIERDGRTTTSRAPAAFFVADSFAPVVITEELWRYWVAHGRPSDLALFPSGRVSFEPRGREEVINDEGAAVALDRFALHGLEWGRETVWFDPQGRLVALKAVDAEFDHVEATRSGYSQALQTFVASAATDGMAALAELSAPMQTAPDERRSLAFVGATLIDGTGAPAVRDSVVIVQNGRIVAAGGRASQTIPAGAQRIDVAGKTILPGLWDMHAHFEQVEWGPLYLAAGITTVRDCGNELDFIRSTRDAIDAGKGLGPSILLACEVDGDGPRSLGTIRLRDESEIPPLVERLKDARCSQVKIYSSVPPRLIAPLARAAHAAGMSVTGHVPNGIGAIHAVEAGMDQINHLEYVARALLPPTYDPDAVLPGPLLQAAARQLDLASSSVKATLAFFRSRNIVVDPTMAGDELNAHTAEENARVEPGLAKVAPPLKAQLGSIGIPPDQSESSRALWKVDLDILRAIHEAGIPIVAGTDQAVPGHSLHRELEIYVSAGFTPLEAIQAATIVPARAMQRDKDVGTLEAGKRADLVVVDGDPLADIRNIRRIVTVVRGGRVYETAKLWRMVGFEP